MLIHLYSMEVNRLSSHVLLKFLDYIWINYKEMLWEKKRNAMETVKTYYYRGRVHKFVGGKRD